MARLYNENHLMEVSFEFKVDYMRRSTSVMKLVIYYRKFSTYMWSSHNQPTEEECREYAIRKKEISITSRILVGDKEFG